jgi:hypothetical protein
VKSVDIDKCMPDSPVLSLFFEFLHMVHACACHAASWWLLCDTKMHEDALNGFAVCCNKVCSSHAALLDTECMLCLLDIMSLIMQHYHDASQQSPSPYAACADSSKTNAICRLHSFEL